MEGKNPRVGSTEVDLTLICRDPRGVEENLSWIVENDFQEQRYSQFDIRMFPFADAADIDDWDKELLRRYSPLYTNAQDSEAEAARLGLRRSCAGCLTQMVASREMLDYALKVFGRDKAISWGENHDSSDQSHIGFFVCLPMGGRSLGELDIAQTYAENQLSKILLASSLSQDATEMEKMSLHTGSMLMVFMTVADLVKINCLGFCNGSDHDIGEMIDWPQVTVQGGLGNVESGKPVITVIGDNPIPAWLIIKQLEEKGLTEKVEICGIGAAGHDIVRFYDRCRVLAPIAKARNIVRHGISDIIMANTSSLDTVDRALVEDAKCADTRVIWTSTVTALGLPDRTDSLIEDIVKDLVAGAPGAWIRSPEKAAEVTLKAAEALKRKGVSLLSEEDAKAEAKKCGEVTEIWLSKLHTNGLNIAKAIKDVEKDGLKALYGVAKNYAPGSSANDVSPDGVRVLDLMVASLGQKAAEDKLKMRPGRGPMAVVETSTWAFSSIFGNSPGNCMLLGCGDADQDDLGWMAYEMTSRNFITFVAGDAAGEVGRYFNETTGQCVFEEFGAENLCRNLINFGSDTAIVHMLDQAMKWARTGAFITHYGSFGDTADCYLNTVACPAIIWGTASDRMYAVASALARAGTFVVVGPQSGFGWDRYLVGNKWDWERWYFYDSSTQKKHHGEPAPNHMIVPVETREEAIILASHLLFKPIAVRDTRGAQLENYLDLCDNAFGERPDDWHLAVRSSWELPVRRRASLLRELEDKHGWKVERLLLKEARLPNGQLVDMETYVNCYDASQGNLFPTRIPRLFQDPELRNYKTSFEVGVKEK